MLAYFNQVFPKKNVSIFLILFSIFTFNNIISLDAQELAEFSKNSAQFAVEMHKALADERPNENIVISPLSIQTSIAMVRMGAEGNTADEIDLTLRFATSGTTAVANSFNSALANYVNSDIVKIANKIYIMQNCTVRKEFSELIKEKFFSSVETINFAQNVEASKTINSWVESKTNNLIKDLVKPDLFNSDTRLVLLNAIHFKGEWKYQFPKNRTRDEDFFLNASDTVQVPMMSVMGSFPHAVLPDLDAAALELPYKGSDLSMLVILPNSRTGLKSLEEKLTTYPLSDVTSKLESVDVLVMLPKFKVEFEVKLNEALKELGIDRMFSPAAEFGKILQKPEPLQVTAVLHKAFIEVSEEGTTAAATTAEGMTKRSLRMPVFDASKPFFYAIRSKSGAVIFGGNFKQPK